MLREARAGAREDVVWHALSLVRVFVGLDLRPTRHVALGPVVGADVDVFLWRAEGSASPVAIAEPRPSTFLFLGAVGRFDFAPVLETEDGAIGTEQACR